MAQTMVVKVTVQEITKYGFKANDKYVGLSKQLSDADKAQIIPGASFEAEYYVSDGGKEYLNKILSTPTVDARDLHKVDAAKKTFKATYKKPTEAISAGLSKDEWAAKDRRISRQGCIQVAVQVQSNFEEAVKLAEQMLEFVNKGME